MLKVKTIEEYIENGEEDLLIERWRTFSSMQNITYEEFLKERKRVDSGFEEEIKAFKLPEDIMRVTLFNSTTMLFPVIEELKDDIIKNSELVLSYKLIMEQILLTIEALNIDFSDDKKNSKYMVRKNLDIVKIVKKIPYKESMQELIEILIKHRKLFNNPIYSKTFDNAVRSSFLAYNTISFETLVNLYKNDLISIETIQEIVELEELCEANNLKIIDDKLFSDFITKEALLTSLIRGDEEQSGIVSQIGMKLIQIYNSRDTKQPSIIQKLPNVTFARYFTIQEQLRKIKECKDYYEEKKNPINLKDLQKYGINLVKMAEGEDNIAITPKYFTEIYDAIINYETKTENSIRKELLPKEEAIKELYDSDFFNGQEMLKLYSFNNPELGITAVSLDTIIEIYEKQYDEEENIIESKDIENILDAKAIYEYYKEHDGITLLFSNFYNRQYNEEDKKALTPEYKKKISSDICEHIKKENEEFVQKEAMALYDAGIIQLEDIKELLPEFQELMYEKYTKKAEEGTFDIDDVRELLMNTQGNITPEINILLLDMQKELILVVEEGGIDKEDFYKLEDLSMITKEELMGLCSKTILMYYNMSLLSEDDFNSLYHDGIIKEDEIFELAQQGYLSGSKIKDLYIGLMLSEKKLEKLYQGGLISKEEYEQALKGLTMEEITKTLGFDLRDENILQDMPQIFLPIEKREIDRGWIGTNNNDVEQKEKIVIDPEYREMFLIGGLKVLRIPEDKILFDEDSGFENNDFYYLPRAGVDTDGNSWIMSERYYQNKERRDLYSYGNALYLMKVKQFAMLIKKAKEEQLKISKAQVIDLEDVWTVNHGKGFGNRLVRRICEVTKLPLKSMYSDEEIKDINNMAKNIDIGTFDVNRIGEPVEREYKCREF